jgi:hypothetical protein
VYLLVLVDSRADDELKIQREEVAQARRRSPSFDIHIGNSSSPAPNLKLKSRAAAVVVPTPADDYDELDVSFKTGTRPLSVPDFLHLSPSFLCIPPVSI